MTRGIERTFSRPFSETFRISKNEDFNGPYLENKNEFLKNSFETVFRASKSCDRGQLVSAFQLNFNIPYSVALRVKRNCSGRDPGDRMFINNMVKYKAYLIESGYESDRIDEHFIKVAKLKRKHTLSNKGGGERKGLQSGKLILSRHGTLCFLISVEH